MATRLVVVAHAPTLGTRDLVFGDRSELAGTGLGGRADPAWRPDQRVRGWACGPEPACVATAALLAGELPGARVVDGLAGPDFGSWTGRPLADIAATDPAGVGDWLTDADARPHGGESLADLVARAGSACDQEPWPEGTSGLVVTPLVARALVVHALGAPAGVMFRVDVAPLTRVVLSRSGTDWRLKRLDDRASARRASVG